MNSLPSHTDILIAGAGPAGTATALCLIEQGIPAERILLMDRQEFPRQKLCGGGLTGRAWERLQRWEIKLEHVWDARGIYLVADGQGQLMLEPTRLGTADRWELDHKMLQKAMALGVRFCVASVLDLSSTSHGWQVQTSLGNISAAYLVGADGYSSRVRRLLGFKAERGGKLLEVTLPYLATDDTTTQPVLEMEFSPALQGVHGYMWTFPFVSARDGKTHVKYGIMDRSGTTDTAKLRAILQQYVDSKQGQLSPLPELLPGYPERYWKPFRSSIRPRAALVGDAWGVDPLLGEGLAVAFEQAEYLAGHMARAWRKNGNLSRWYNIIHPFTATGWNLWFLKTLGDFVYEGRSSFWLGILTVDKGLSRLSRTSRFGGYGRFARHPLLLSVIAIRHFFRPPSLWTRKAKNRDARSYTKDPE